MSDTTAIEWCDSTFNPWEGCQKVGPGCDNCYAENRNARFGGGVAVNFGPGAPRRRTSASNWAKPLLWEREHEAFTLMHGRRRRVFCASLADVFDNEVDPQWRVDLFALIRSTPHLDWLLLTKRIGNVVSMLRSAREALDYQSDRDLWLWLKAWESGDEVPANVWLGATVVSQAEADRDIPKLLAVQAAVRFLSIEPMLGPVYAEDIPDPAGGVCLKPLAGLRWVGDGQGRSEVRRLEGRIDWVICGGESGPNARPMHPDWARSLRDQCAAAGVPFLFKQWGEWKPPYGSGDVMQALTEGHPRNAESMLCGDAVMTRIGKKAAGRVLDGRTHDGFPEPRA